MIITRLTSHHMEQVSLQTRIHIPVLMLTIIRKNKERQLIISSYYVFICCSKRRVKIYVERQVTIQ